MDSEFEEYDAFEKLLNEKYPKMFENQFGGIAVGKGWWPIIESLCSNIHSHIIWKKGTCPQVAVMQIKEKFGGLRFYYDGGDDTIRGMVSMAETWASHTCETCGVPGNSREGGWIKTLCNTHEDERQERMKERFKE